LWARRARAGFVTNVRGKEKKTRTGGGRAAAEVGERVKRADLPTQVLQIVVCARGTMEERRKQLKNEGKL